MLRLTELKLPLDHPADALRPAICERLGIADKELLDFSIFKRSYDARKKSAITLIYTLDITVADEAALVGKFADDRHVGPTPDTRYKFVAEAPADLKSRPVVIGTGPCGLLAGLILEFERDARAVEAHQNHFVLAQRHQQGRVFYRQVSAVFPVRNVNQGKRGLNLTAR